MKKGMDVLQENEVFIMIYNSEYRQYIAIGTDFDVMAKKILAKYNSFCSKEWKVTLKKIATLEEYEEAAFLVYKIPMDFCFDTEYMHELCEKNMVGDYLNKYRAKTKKKSACWLGKEKFKWED